MPFGDRTGPQGFGPMTGRGAGFCTGNNAPGNYNRRCGFGRGFFRRGGGGGWFGFRRGFGYPFQADARYGADYSSAGPEGEKNMLEENLNFLRGEVERMEKRLNELESGK